MSHLVTEIYEFWENNDYEYAHYTSEEGADIFLVGIVGQYQIMKLQITVEPRQCDGYELQCSIIEYARPTGATYERLKDEQLPKNVTLLPGPEFQLNRNDMPIFDAEIFCDDCNAVINAADCFVTEPEEDSIQNPWLTFIEDMTHITFSAAKGGLPNAQEINASLIEQIVQEMGLQRELEIYRSDDTNASRVYPTEKEDQYKYIKGLLHLIFRLEVAAHEMGVTLVHNNILYMAMRAMELPLEERKDLTIEVFEHYRNRFYAKEAKSLLDGELMELIDENRVIRYFEYEGILPNGY